MRFQDGEERRGGRRLAVPALIAALAIATGAIAADVPAHAAPPAPAAGDYPSSSSETDVLHWIATRTSISRPAILVVEPKAVVAMVRRAPRAEGAATAEADIRAELLTPDAAAKAQWRSVLYSLQLDCAARRFRIVGRTTFALPDLQGPSQSQSQPLAWGAVVETAPIGKAWQAACAPGFVFPYAARGAASAAPAEAQAYEVLLGSFAEPGNARVASDRLDRAMHPALAGRRIVIRSQTVNGRVFAAVTVGGFGTASQAETFCAGVRKIPLECVIKRTGALAQTPRIQPSSARAVSASSAPRP